MNYPKKAAAPPVKQVHPAIRESLQPDKTQYRILVRYYRIMRRHRVYPLRVNLQKFNSGRGLAETTSQVVSLRALIPGAMVNPPELSLDTSKAGEVATFYVTPMAKGSLRRPHVQLVGDGRVIQQVAVPMKSVTQRLTWVLAALTILVPAFLLYATKYNRLTPPAPMEIKVPVDPNKPNGELRPFRPQRAGIAGGSGDGSGGRGGQGGPNTGGEMIEAWVKENIPPTPKDILVYPGKAVGTVYDYACNMTNQFLSFYVGAFLLGATLVSWAFHVRRPARKYSQPVVLQP